MAGFLLTLVLSILPLFASCLTHPRAPPPLLSHPLSFCPPLKGKSLTLQVALKGEVYSALGGAGNFDAEELSRKDLLHICNTPFDAVPEQVYDLFPKAGSACPPPNSVYLVQRFDSKSAGQAFVAFGSPEAAAEAAALVNGVEVPSSSKGQPLVRGNGQPMAPRKLEAAVVPRLLLWDALTRPPQEKDKPWANGAGSHALRQQGTDSFLRVKGIPYDTNERHLLDYFAEFSPSASHVIMRNGKADGAYTRAQQLPENAASFFCAHLTIHPSLEQNAPPPIPTPTLPFPNRGLCGVFQRKERPRGHVQAKGAHNSVRAHALR